MTVRQVSRTGEQPKARSRSFLATGVAGTSLTELERCPVCQRLPITKAGHAAVAALGYRMRHSCRLRRHRCASCPSRSWSLNHCIAPRIFSTQWPSERVNQPFPRPDGPADRHCGTDVDLQRAASALADLRTLTRRHDVEQRLADAGVLAGVLASLEAVAQALIADRRVGGMRVELIIDDSLSGSPTRHLTKLRRAPRPRSHRIASPHPPRTEHSTGRPYARLAK